MRISNALVGIILTFTSWNVRASKNGMSGTDAIAAAAAEKESVQREFRSLMSSNNNNSNNYQYKRNYITIIEPDNFLSTDPDGQSAGARIVQVTDGTMTIPTSIGTAIIQNGTFLLQFIYHIIRHTLRLLIYIITRCSFSLKSPSFNFL
jgi:hypothetical protein